MLSFGIDQIAPKTSVIHRNSFSNGVLVVVRYSRSICTDKYDICTYCVKHGDKISGHAGLDKYLKKYIITKLKTIVDLFVSDIHVHIHFVDKLNKVYVVISINNHL